jgi:C4-dicarboxylate-specific signal transduction histidine kinase
VAREEVARAQARFPRSTLSCRAATPGAEAASALVRGGAESLRRILAALVENACEGDGRRTATRVEVAVSEQAALGALAIEVLDDGPGFAAADLAQRIAPFVTSKPHSAGLGLYTAERLARASGGSLRRATRPGGGAAVSVFLASAPRQPPPAG